MPVPVFQTSAGYQIKSGDYLLLLFQNEKTPCFDKKALPQPVLDVLKAPKDKGGVSTVFRGLVGKDELFVRAARLDGKIQTAATNAKVAAANALDLARKEGAMRLVILLDAAASDVVVNVQEGVVMGGYVYDRFLSDKKKSLPVVAVLSEKNAFKSELAKNNVLLDYMSIARDLLNEPPNYMRPPQLADAYAKAAKAAGLKVTVWDEKQLAKEGCGGTLGVGKGSAAQPRIVIAEYAPRGAKKHLALVGKGLTFDTGGYCLKPGDSQASMQFDMAGSAAVMMAACAIAKLKLPIRITAITPIAENMISGDSFPTTSILTTRSGRTIEVRNTDAEGRLVLADGLALAVERKPDYVVDAATLTGAACVALGNDLAAVFGSDAKFTKTLLEASAVADECFWELPLFAPYREQLKSDYADCKNIGAGRYGGAIIGALFLEPWVPEGMPWLHLDIAGPGGKEADMAHLGKGGKGFGVKTLVALAEKLA
ncbi:TPA: leucyl aminopeptidase [Candidatus Sumerlaeota bacterium]|nr:leucyl aminopeptidase [Candidatus Sumerlaeota bacterium]